MDIVLSHISALELTRAESPCHPRRRPAPRSLQLPERVPKAAEIDAVCPAAAVSGRPFHVLVEQGAGQRRTGRVASHGVRGASLPHGSILRTERDGLYACAPELLLTQLAATEHRVEIVRLGFELCGSYAIRREHPGSFYQRDAPTSIARMSAYVDRIPGLHGVKTMRWALRYILPNSASPRETITAMLLEMPCAFGGCGLKRPLLNHEVVTKGPGRRTYRIDLFWPSAKLGLEYDSDREHTGADRIARDALRRNDLESLGITMLTVTNRQVKSLYAFNKLASIIAGRLGTNVRPRCDDYPARQRKLHGTLLGGGI